MSRIVRISASQNWLTTGGKLQFQLDWLPLGYRIEAMLLEGDLTVTAPAGGITSEQLTMFVDSIECGRRLRTTGIGESAMDWLAHGKDTVRPAALTSGAGQSVKTFWPITFRDPRFVEPQDFSPATNFYRGQTLDVYLANPTNVVAGAAVTAGSAQLVVFLSPLPHGVVPASVVKNYAEVTGKEVKLPAGRYVDVCIVKNDGTSITEAELGNVQLTRDGRENLLEKVRSTQLARAFNFFVATGTTLQAASAEGEALPNSGSLPLAPLVYAMAPQKATKLPAVESQLVLTFDGTLAANVARVFYRLVEECDEVTTAKAAAKLGYELNAETVATGKTASKQGISDAASFKKTHGVMARRVMKRPAA